MSLLFIAVLLFSPIAMFAGISPFASAATTPDITVNSDTALMDAVGAAPADGSSYVIALERDIVLTESLIISYGQNITLVSDSDTEFFKLVGRPTQNIITVNSGGALKLDGIIVTHESGFSGRGVSNSGNLVLVSGEISDNEYSGDGGGVYNVGTFVMFGGEISGNIAAVGGGVYNAGSGGNFTMFGGKIIGNTATKSTDGGGGVQNRCIFTMFGGEISNNNAVYVGGGVSNFGGNFTMKGGVIANNKVDTYGGGVYSEGRSDVGSASFKMLGGKICGNTAMHGGGVFRYSNDFPDEFIVSGETCAIVNNIASGYGGGVYTRGNLVLSEGCMIDGNKATFGGGVFNAPIGVSTMIGGIITNNTASQNGGGVYNNGGSFTIVNSVIDNNTATNRGGGVYSYGILTVSGADCMITNNTSVDGGGVYNSGTFTLSDAGIISNNKAAYGGGIFNGNSGTFEMINGKISNNTANISGGGVYNSVGTLTMVAGMISGNIAGVNGGGIWITDTNTNLGRLSVVDGVVFSNNRASIAYDRNPADDVTYENQIGENVIWTSPFTQGYNNYDISYTAGPEYVFTYYNINYILNGGLNPVDNPATYKIVDLPLNIINPAKLGYTFLGWTVRYENGSSVTVPPARPYTIPEGTTGDILLTALWVVSDVEDTIKYTIAYQGNGHTSGTAPTDTNSPYVSGSTVIILDQGSLTKEGYTFLGWTTNNPNNPTITHAPGTTFTILSNTILYAVWSEGTQQQYTITYHPGIYGTFKEQITSNLNYGDPTPNAPIVTGTVGWKFTGWNPTLTPTVEGDATYVAQWEQEVFTVIFKDWDGTVLKTQEVAYGGSATAPVNPSRSGYTFTGWDRSFTNVISDITVTAQYTSTGSSGGNSGGGSGGSSTPKPPATTTPPPTTTPPSTTPPPTTTPPAEGEVVAVWALVNLILSITGVILAIILTICVLLQRKQKQEEQEQKNTQRAGNSKMTTNNNNEDEDEVKKQRQRRLFWFATAIIMGIAGIIVFILTEDMRLPMALVDKWTIVNAIIFIIEVIAILLTFKHKKANDDDDEAKQEVEKPTNTSSKTTSTS